MPKGAIPSSICWLRTRWKSLATPNPSSWFPIAICATSLAVGVASLAILIWMIVAGPGYLGHGAALLWVGAPRGAAPIYDIRVSPGRCHGAAQCRSNCHRAAHGRAVHKVHACSLATKARPSGSRLRCSRSREAPDFSFFSRGLPEGVEYYVEAGPLRSQHFNLRVVDLPSVKQIRVTYHLSGMDGIAD